MSKTKMLAAKELIDEKRYDEARGILRSVDHPKAAEWLEKLDKIDPPNAFQKILRAVIPKASVQTKPNSNAVRPPKRNPAAIIPNGAAPLKQIETVLVVEEEPEEDPDDLMSLVSDQRGHYPKAVSGEFDGIHFRSQLEIRFAAELKKRNIAYKYESARVGKGKYMIDFYLPDHGIWVEVKGKMDARDEFLLQECAQVLRASHNEALYIYASDRKMHLVQDDKLEYLWPGKFWEMLETKQSSSKLLLSG
ncbi:MAG: hypothetical protein H0X30_14465 [Anaerolineae bacterium]|nr:hypothetical protein [Anaerolineae bacterium]